MDPYTLEQLDSTEPQGFHALLRFLRVVNRHRMILVGLVAAAAFLAVVRHKQIPKQYESTARLMVRQVSADPKSQSNSATEGLLASYRQLLLSDRVLTDTVKELKSLPPELAAEPDRTVWPIRLREMLVVTFETDEYVLEIKCRSTSPESTVNVIEGLSVASGKFMDEYQKDLSVELMKQLERKGETVLKGLLAKENELLEARQNCGDIALSKESEDSHPLVQRVSHLNENLTTVQSRRLQLEATLVSARELVATNSDLTSALKKLEEIVGEDVLERIPGAGATDPKAIEELRAKVALLETELNGLRRHFGSGHSDIIRREQQLAGQKQRLANMQLQLGENVNVGVRDPQVGQWLIKQIEAEVQATRQYEQSLKHEYSVVEADALELSGKLAGIQVAEREVETLRELHSSLLKRLNSINPDHGSGAFKVAPLSDPRIPKFAVYPVLTNTLVMFCVAAVALALGVIYVIDLMDDRLRSPEEVRDELGLNVLGIIRKLPQHEVDQARIYVNDFPQTTHAECFRTLKTSITLSPMDTKCIAITSTEASEGKTTTTVNLAASYAQTGQRTLLIDADMRRPGLSRLLEIRGNGGLSEVLRADSDIPQMCKERVVQTEVPLLEVLPCGPRILNAGMLLSMPALADILDWAVSEYDQVIVDCPPTLPVSDAAIVGRYVDSMLFLMNPDKTHRRSVARAVDQLRSMGLKIVGIVANTSLSEDTSSYGYQYGYGYGNDYGYGHDDEEDDLDSVGFPTSPSSDLGKVA